MKIKCLIIIFLLLAIPAFLFAQTAQAIEEILDTEAVSNQQAAWLVLEAADVSYRGDAFQYASENGWLPKRAEANSRARLDQVCLLIMQAFDMSGGIFYTIAGSPRYAYRELTYLNVIQERAVPGMAVSGELLLFMVGRMLSIADDPQARRRSEEEAQRLARQRAEEEEALAREINARLEAQKVADAAARVTDVGVTISLSNIQFLPNSAELAESEKAKLREIAKILQTVPSRNILITGHTALAGTRASRQQTSMERASAVADYLISLGARTPSEITIRGLGADQPVANNNTPEGMAKNRRVEITIMERN